jgi:hypothetical protein
MIEIYISVTFYAIRSEQYGCKQNLVSFEIVGRNRQKMADFQTFSCSSASEVHCYLSLLMCGFVDSIHFYIEVYDVSIK